LYLWMGMTCFSSKWILSHSTWYKFSRSGQALPQRKRRIHGRNDLLAQWRSQWHNSHAPVRNALWDIPERWRGRRIQPDSAPERQMAAANDPPVARRSRALLAAQQSVSRWRGERVWRSVLRGEALSARRVYCDVREWGKPLGILPSGHYLLSGSERPGPVWGKPLLVDEPLGNEWGWVGV